MYKASALLSRSSDSHGKITRMLQLRTPPTDSEIAQYFVNAKFRMVIKKEVSFVSFAVYICLLYGIA